MATFPTVLLHKERKLGGLGIKRFSTLTFSGEVKDDVMSSHSVGRQISTAESLIPRTGRMTGVDFSSGWANHIAKATDGKSRAWITSLVEFL